MVVELYKDRKKKANSDKDRYIRYGIFIIRIYARGVMVIVVGIGHGDTSSNPGRD